MQLNLPLHDSRKAADSFFGIRAQPEPILSQRGEREIAPVDGSAVASDNTHFRVTIESTRVSLTVRKTGASLAYQQWADYTAYDHGRAIGRIYQDRATRPALRWFWSITMIGARHKGIRTDGCTPTLKQAKAELQANWHKWLVSARLEEPTVPNDHH
jgi:hypothetical protein